MFDNKQTAYTELNFNAVSGTILKSHSKSRITRCHMKSPMAGYLFDDSYPTLRKNGKGIVVLQVMLCGDSEMLVEYIYSEDYVIESGEPNE